MFQLVERIKAIVISGRKYQVLKLGSGFETVFVKGGQDFLLRG
jgi:hypothetical protein